MKTPIRRTETVFNWMLALLLTAMTLSAPTSTAQSSSECVDGLQCESSWIGMSDSERLEVFAFAEEYKAFIHRARTELSFVA